MTQTERTQLTPHFKLYEFTRSGVAADHDLSNCPNAAQTAPWRRSARTCSSPCATASDPS